MTDANRLNPRILAATLALLVASHAHALGTQTRPGRRGGAGRATSARLPRFEDYPVKEVYKGRVAPVVVGGRRERMFRTRLREDSRGGPNFAGRYTVVFWGCGTGCAQLAVVDAKTGRVYWPPHEYIDIPDGQDEPENRNFRLDSKLLVVTRSHYDARGGRTAYYYNFDQNRFRLIRRAELNDDSREDSQP